MKYLFLIMCAMLTFPVFADDAKIIAQAQNWLQGFQTAQARFEQIDYQGQSQYGQFYIHRPGRLRFEYDAPIKDYIVADGYLIHFYDGESDQVNSAPIGSTLADFILRDNITFNDKVIVDDVRDIGQNILITLSQADQQGMGQIILNFAKEPFALTAWRIIDAQGFTTDMILSDMKQGGEVPPSLFTIDQNRDLNE